MTPLIGCQLTAPLLGPHTLALAAAVFWILAARLSIRFAPVDDILALAGQVSIFSFELGSGMIVIVLGLRVGVCRAWHKGRVI